MTRPKSLPRDIASLSVAFWALRALVWALGLRFDAQDIDHFWHFLDLKLLESQLLESLFFLHSLPPLYNLYLGVGVKAFGVHAPWFFAAVAHLVGWSFVIATYALARALDLGRRTSGTAALVLSLTPTALLYENYLFYTQFEAALLMTSAALLVSALRREDFRGWALFFGALAILSLIRSMFHLVWYLAAFALVVGFSRHRPAALWAGLLGLALVLTPYVKNWTVFGTFTNSSWLGMSLGRMTLRQLPPERIAERVRDGRLAPIAAVKPYSSVEVYDPFLPRPSPTGHTVLDQERKPNGEINLHHLAFIEISRAYRKEAMKTFAEDPGVYVESVLLATRRYLEAPSDFRPLDRIRPAIARYEAAWNRLFQFPWTLRGRTIGGFGLAPFWLLLSVVLGGLRILRFGLQRDWVRLGPWLFMTGNILYVSLVGVLFEIGENNRFRYDVQGFIFLIGVWALNSSSRRGCGRPQDSNLGLPYSGQGRAVQRARRRLPRQEGPRTHCRQPRPAARALGVQCEA